ncbi:hypothetical protein HYH02_002651 [Chlamydomonas schloesseri]|uniref:Major facilitator superfamily (MFS) profile domain-containing protein n=1 Tax=Chlamydomonas schloesseri TaxID=2026947 RepID=A0A836BAF5_9CHLO|nr:hypothetical protein HYH02_002651 [Chlamydomonas schloesseri]|eukprot:KAG2452408.1 hypothetical protein HYH02_002651 [Chlamydomonas schloesseri]
MPLGCGVECAALMRQQQLAPAPRRRLAHSPCSMQAGRGAAEGATPHVKARGAHGGTPRKGSHEKSPVSAEGLSAASGYEADALTAPQPQQQQPGGLQVPTLPLLEGLVSDTVAGAGVGAFGWQKRWTVVALCFVAFVLCNLDRVNMSVAILPMASQYGWDAATMGLVQSSFFWGYLLTQVAGGVLADRYGGRLVLGLGVLWWSLATALTPVAAAAGLPALLLARCLMGVGEGVAMPAMNALLAKWVPGGERSRSLALVYSGMFIGSVVGLGASPHMLNAFGWQSVFYVFGSLGVAWHFVWRSQVRSSPAEDSSLHPEERAYILANTPNSSREKAGAIPWRALLSRREVWAIILTHFCHNWGLFILLTWMPAYYNQVLGLNLTQSGLLSVLPWVAQAVMANVAGWAADGLVERGVSVTTVRKVMQSIGLLGPAFFLSQLGGVTSATGAVLCMIGSQGLDAFSQAGLYANHTDIGPRYAGVLLGLSNTAGVLAGVLGSLATGFLLQAGGDAGGWSNVWTVAVGFYLAGTAIWLSMSSGEKIFD